MDSIFKALNDPARRALLDSLRQKDGQTLSELEGQLDMTRFGVMKHLGVLETASLITTKKVGRFKYHYLNAVPLQEVIDRWIEPLLARPMARGMIDLKTRLEGTDDMLDKTKPDLMLHTYIRCSQAALWDALTRADQKARYHFATHRISGDLTADGDTLVLARDDGSAMLTETVLSIEPKSRLETSFQLGDAAVADSSRVVFTLEPSGDDMKLTIEHYALPPEMSHTRDGWTKVLAGLKTYLETGEGHRFQSVEA